MPPSRRYRLGSISLVAVGTLILTGCGSGTTTLSGTVRISGQPVSGGSVILYCADKQIVRGIIDNGGQYSIPNVPYGVAIATVQSHMKVPPGMRIKQDLPPVINGPLPPAVESNRAIHATILPPRYSHPEESGLTVNVDREHAVYEINLTP